MLAIRPFRIEVLPIIALSLLFLAGTAGAEVVYDNSTTSLTDTTGRDFLPFNLLTEAYEYLGDEVALDGTGRTVTQFDLILSSSEATTLDSLTLTFWDFNLAGAVAGTASGDELWSATKTNVAVNGQTTVTFTVPSVTVPDAFAWTISTDSDVAGMAMYDSPTIGSSPTWFDDSQYMWNRCAALGWDWVPLTWDPTANFGATVYAVPEPTSLAILAAVGIGAILRRRRR